MNFRSTDSTEGLPASQATSVEEISSMLFLKNNLRIRSASYAVCPPIDINGPTAEFEHLINVQAFVAYLYASPRHEFGDLFLSPEHTSMAVFAPGKVWRSLVQENYHVESVGPEVDFADSRKEIEGYAGLYDFRYPFWCRRFTFIRPNASYDTKPLAGLGS